MLIITIAFACSQIQNKIVTLSIYLSSEHTPLFSLISKVALTVFFMELDSEEDSCLFPLGEKFIASQENVILYSQELSIICRKNTGFWYITVCHGLGKAVWPKHHIKINDKIYPDKWYWVLLGWHIFAGQPRSWCHFGSLSKKPVGFFSGFWIREEALWQTNVHGTDMFCSAR